MGFREETISRFSVFCTAVSVRDCHLKVIVRKLKCLSKKKRVVVVGGHGGWGVGRRCISTETENTKFVDYLRQ
jgi:hypothetical protein